MTWLGNWLGGGGAGAPAPAPEPRAATGGASIFGKVWRVLAAAFDGSTTRLANTIALPDPDDEAGHRPTLVVTKVGSENSPATRQEMRISIRLMAQATQSSRTEAILTDALAALERANTISVVDKTTADEDYDELAATDGLYRQFQTVEIRG